MTPRDSRGLVYGALVLVLAVGAAAGFRLQRRFSPLTHLPAYDLHQTRVRLLGTARFDEFGATVSSCGDVNGDGAPDVLVGAPLDGRGGRWAGRALLFDGRTGRRLQAWNGPAPTVAFGYGILGGPDLDGDGVPDVLMGGTGGGRSLGGQGGAVWAHAGRDGRRLGAWTGRLAHDEFGHALAAAGDVNGDGTEDWIAGAPGDWKKRTAGYVLCISGKDGSVLREFRGDDALGDRFGFAVAGGLDVDGDRVPDVVVGELDPAGSGDHLGAVHVFSGADGRRLHRFVGEKAGDELGHGVDLVPDVDGDGVPEIVAGAFRVDDEGWVRLWSGRTGEPLLTLPAEHSGDCYAHSVRYAGDVDGDGTPDLVVGAPRARRDGVPEVGAVWVHSAKDGRVVLLHRGDLEKEHLGYVVAPLGDVDGDGRAEVLAGSSLPHRRPGRAQVLGVRRAAR